MKTYIIVMDFEDRQVLEDNVVYLSKDVALSKCDELNKLWETNTYYVEQLQVIE